MLGHFLTNTYTQLPIEARNTVLLLVRCHCHPPTALRLCPRKFRRGALRSMLTPTTILRVTRHQPYRRRFQTMAVRTAQCNAYLHIFECRKIERALQASLTRLPTTRWVARLRNRWMRPRLHLTHLSQILSMRRHRQQRHVMDRALCCRCRFRHRLSEWNRQLK